MDSHSSPFTTGPFPDTHANPIEKQGAKNKTKPERHGCPWQAAKLAVWGGSGGVWQGRGAAQASGRSAIPRTARAKALDARKGQSVEAKPAVSCQRQSGETMRAHPCSRQVVVCSSGKGRRFSPIEWCVMKGS